MKRRFKILSYFLFNGILDGILQFHLSFIINLMKIENMQFLICIEWITKLRCFDETFFLKPIIDYHPLHTFKKSNERKK